MAKLPPEEFERWQSPREVLGALPRSLSWDTARQAIYTRLEDGLVRAACGTLVDKGGSRGPVEVIKDTWKAFDYLHPAAKPFWDTGLFERQIADSTGYGRTQTARLYDVRFHPDDVAKLVKAVTPRPPRGLASGAQAGAVPLLSSPLPPVSLASARSAAEIGVERSLSDVMSDGDRAEMASRIAQLEAQLGAAASAPKRHPGGAPPKPWWDDLWVEIIRRVYLQGYQPKSIAEIARDMIQWASENGHEISEPTAKRAARKLWAVFDE